MAVLPSATLSRARGAHDQETGSKDVTPTMSGFKAGQTLSHRALHDLQGTENPAIS